VALDVFSLESRPVLQYTCFYLEHMTGFLVEVNLIENSVLTGSDVARFPSARGEISPGVRNYGNYSGRP